MLRQQLPICALILAFLGLATLYGLVTPMGEGPDEPGHAAYVFFLARAGRLPVQRADPRQSDAPGEGHQPPLAYALAAPLVAWLPRDQRTIDLPGNASFTWSGGSEVNAVAHGSREYPPWGGAVLAWHLARVASAALGAVAVLGTYLAALALSGANRGLALLAALLVALNPQFLFVCALVTNDALLAALSALLLWMVVDAARWRPTVHALLVGVVLGLALLTKQNALLFIPVALAGVAGRGLAGLRAKGESATRQAVLRGVALPCLLALAAALIVAGWWYARNLRLYGDLFGFAAFRAEFTTQPFDPGDPAAWRDALAQLHDSFWARFGWMNVPAPDWALAAVALVEALGLAGLVAALVGTKDEGRKTKDETPVLSEAPELMTKEQGRRTKNDVGPIRPPFFGFEPSASDGAAPGRPWFYRLAGGRWALAALPALALAWVVSFALTAGLVAWQGRLLFVALPPLAILLARGLLGGDAGAPQGWRRARRVATTPVVGLLMGALALWIPFGVIRPAYPFHTLPEATALAQLGTPVYGRFRGPGERGAELRGWRIEGPLRAGTTPELLLTWHARGRANRNWLAFIHIVDADGRTVAEDNRRPQDGAFPMTQWVDGDWVQDRHPLALPATLAPGVYRLRVGLFDPRTTRRTGMYDAHGDLQGDYLEVGAITVTAN